MFNIGTPELLVIMLVALLVLGPAKLPQAARQVGKALGELRRLSSGFQDELREAMQETVPSKPVPPPAVDPVLTVPPGAVGEGTAQASPGDEEPGPPRVEGDEPSPDLPDGPASA